jgi:hypothetical protein
MLHLCTLWMCAAFLLPSTRFAWLRSVFILDSRVVEKGGLVLGPVITDNGHVRSITMVILGATEGSSLQPLAIGVLGADPAHTGANIFQNPGSVVLCTQMRETKRATPSGTSDIIQWLHRKTTYVWEQHTRKRSMIISHKVARWCKEQAFQLMTSSMWRLRAEVVCDNDWKISYKGNLTNKFTRWECGNPRAPQSRWPDSGSSIATRISSKKSTNYHERIYTQELDKSWKNDVFWDVTRCGCYKKQRFGGTGVTRTGELGTLASN